MHEEGVVVVVSLANFPEKNSVFDHVHEHLNPMLGSSLIANFSACHEWPTQSYHATQRFTKRNPCILHI